MDVKLLKFAPIQSSERQGPVISSKDHGTEPKQSYHYKEPYMYTILQASLVCRQEHGEQTVQLQSTAELSIPKFYHVAHVGISVPVTQDSYNLQTPHNGYGKGVKMYWVSDSFSPIYTSSVSK
jgi:hypothetical protein